MTKIAVILILVGLTVMASAYRMSGQDFDQDERAQLIEQLQGIVIISILWIYAHMLLCIIIDSYLSLFS